MKKNAKLISLILGGLSLVLSIIGVILVYSYAASGWLALFGIIVGIAAVIFSASVSKENGKNGAIGMLMGLAAILLGLVVAVSCLICNCSCGDNGLSHYEEKEYERAIEELADSFGF
ncbi:MAG: hypothetical protein IJX77_00240 [Ruminococcus sp.]|nr:hypothetical protein [Ruminococcus sp.]